MNYKRVVIGFLASIGFIYLIIWVPRFGGLFKGELSIYQAFFGQARIDFGHLWRVILRVDILPMIICFLLTPLHVLVRTHRWALMIRPLGRLKMIDGYSLQMVGYFSNTTLPLRIGEVIRGVLLSRRIGASKSAALATVVLERSLDFVSLSILIAILGFVYSFPPEIKRAAVILSVFVLGMVLVMLIMTFAEGPMIGKIRRIIGTVPGGIGDRLIGIIEHFTSGFEVLKSGRRYPVIIMETIIIWLLYAGQELLVLYAFRFHIDYPLIAASPILVAFIILAVNAVGLSIPSAPGGVGTFHAACIFSLALFGVGVNEAAGFALVIHAASVIFFISGGIPFMWREGLRLGELRQLKENSEAG